MASSEWKKKAKDIIDYCSETVKSDPDVTHDRVGKFCVMYIAINIT